MTKVCNGSIGSTYPHTSSGTHVIIRHDSTHYSMYYHVQHDSILVAKDDWVSAGQKIADSGNTGNSSGPHLHYVLMTVSKEVPAPEQTYRPWGKWTTDPGRVPWLATKNAESTSGSESICYGDTVTHWVKFDNEGGRTWSQSNDAYGRGRIVLYSTTSSGTTTQASNFKATDWESTSLVGPADQVSVGPSALGTFTFGLKGIGTEGTYYVNYFNLYATGLRWFDYATIGNYSITIFIVPHQAC